MRNFGIQKSGRADPWGPSGIDSSALADGRNTQFPSAQSLPIPGALFERSQISQAFLDIACAVFWMLFGVIVLFGFGFGLLVLIALATVH